RHVVAAERDEGESRPTDAARDASPSRNALPGRRDHAAEREHEAELLKPARMLAPREAPDDRHGGGGARDRRDDRDRAGRHAAVEGDEPGRPEGRREAGPEDLAPGRPVAADRYGYAEDGEPHRLRHREHRERGQDTGLDAAEEVAEAPGGARRQGEEGRYQ